MKLRKTPDGRYTFFEVDEKGRETKDAHYKFVKIKGVADRKSNQKRVF